MVENLFLPLTDPQEIAGVLDGVPIQINREAFVRFALGFPRKYLISTPRIEMVKHFLLFDGLDDRRVISSLSREGDRWKLNLITRDQQFLFSQITASLSCFSMDIRSAEAFSNANHIVFDRFVFTDPKGRLEQEPERKAFQHLLEETIEGKRYPSELVGVSVEDVSMPQGEEFEVTLDNHAHTNATLLTLRCRDRVGLLYLLSVCLNMEACSIEMAFIETYDGMVEDRFYVQFEGRQLTQEKMASLKKAVEHLHQRWHEERRG